MQRFNITLLTVLLGVATLSSHSLPIANAYGEGETGANEIGFIEEFALAADRQAALDKLIPGSDQYYFFNCLHHQTTGELTKVEPLLREWIKRHGENQRVKQIQRRQWMLTYPKNSKKSLDFLQRELSLHYNHQRQVLDAKPTFPTKLDPKKISREALTKRFPP